MLDSAIQDIWLFSLIDLIPMLICALILVIIALAGAFKGLFKKSIVLLLIAFSIFISLFSIVEIALFDYDVRNENFDVYYGKFDYMHVSGHNLDVITFADGSDLYIRSAADLGIDTGTYTGYILYCKNSRWVLAYSSVPFE